MLPLKVRFRGESLVVGRDARLLPLKVTQDTAIGARRGALLRQVTPELQQE
jgi:hypothetical protein